MHRFIICLSLGVFASLADEAAAQRPRTPQAESRVSELAYRPARPRTRPVRTEADILFHHKAAAQAQQRVARIELRKWQGISVARPYVPPSRTGNTLDLNAAFMVSPGGWYAGPVWGW